MDVSKNSGTPKSSILIGFSIINHPFWGTPIFGIPISTPGSMAFARIFEAPPIEAACPALKFSSWRRSAARPCERIPRRVTRARRFGEGSRWGGELGVIGFYCETSGGLPSRSLRSIPHTHIPQSWVNLTTWKMMLVNWGQTHLSCFFLGGVLFGLIRLEPLPDQIPCVLRSSLLKSVQLSRKLSMGSLGGGNSNMFYVSLRSLGKWSNLTSIFFKWVGSTTN